MTIVLFFSVVFGSLFAKAANVTTTIKLTTNGIVAQDQQIVAFNYQIAFTKIVEGKYKSTDVSSTYWTTLEKQYPSSDGTGITLPNQMTLAQGVTHSEDDAKNIISMLYQMGDFAFLQTLEGGVLPNVLPGNTNTNSSPVGGFTSKNGFAKGSIPSGFTIFAQNSNSSYLGNGIVSADSSHFTFDTLNTSSQLSFSATSLPSANHSGERQYTVDYGQELTFTLKIDSSLLQNGGQLQLQPMSNLVIDSISTPMDQQDLLGDTINPNAYLPSGTAATSNLTQSNLSSTASTVGQGLTKQSITAYQTDLPSTSSTTVITITAHINPTVTIDKTMSISNNPLDATIPIDISNAPSTPLTMKAIVTSGAEITTATSPVINSSGINFAMVDGKTDKLAVGASYVLGKKINGEDYYYLPGGGWQSSSTDDNLSDYEVFSGGQQYFIGTTSTAAIPYNTTQFAFNSSTDRKINESLIQIRGLGNGNYFLTQLTAAHGHGINNQLYPFTISSKNVVTANGNNLIKNSIAFAAQPLYSLNTKIPDYAAGSNEYNVLPVTSQGIKGINLQKAIIYPILFIIIAMLIVGIILVFIT